MAERRNPPASRFHIDLCEARDGWVVVLGWAVRTAAEEPEVLLRSGARRLGPVATFPRPDVVDYLVHTGVEGVRRADLAYSFVLAAKGKEVPRLIVQGRQADLAPATTAEADRAVLDRYADALRPLPPSPATEAARGCLRALRGEPEAVAAAGETQRSGESLLADCATQGDIFTRLPVAGCRLALFAIHQPGRFLTHAQHAMLSALRAGGWATVLVNSNPGGDAGPLALRERLVAGCVTRPDHGRDFASWLLGLSLLNAHVEQATHLLFCNDSFVGPFDDLAGVFAHHAASGADIWGLTDSWEQAWHVQSSFFALSARALASEAFRDFRAAYAYPDARDEVVRQGEVGLSRALVADRSLAIAVLAPYAALACTALEAPPAPEPDEFSRALRADLRAGVPRNPQHVFWEALLSGHRIPFVKRDLLARNPAGIPDYWRILPAIAAAYGPEQAMRVEADLRATATRAPVR